MDDVDDDDDYDDSELDRFSYLHEYCHCKDEVRS